MFGSDSKRVTERFFATSFITSHVKQTRKENLRHPIKDFAVQYEPKEQSHSNKLKSVSGCRYLFHFQLKHHEIIFKTDLKKSSRVFSSQI